MTQWFVVHTQPGKEQLAQAHLLQQGFKVYFPRYKRLCRHARKVSTNLAPLFPRYIFVGLDLEKDPWRRVNGTRGVAYILMADQKPAVVSTSIIEQLRKEEDSEGLVTLSSLALFTKGQAVHINNGFFSGQKATFEKIDDNQRIKLLLNFLGQEHYIYLPLYAVEAA